MRRFCGFLFLAALPLAAQTCEPLTEIKSAIDGLSSMRPDERTAAAKKIRDQFPADYFAHRIYQEQFFRGVFSEPLRAEYKALRDAHPDDPMYLTLYGRALTGSSTPQAIPLLEKALELHPDYPWARLKLAEIYNSPAFHDDGKLQTNLAGFWRTCPDSLSGYNLLSRVNDAEFLKVTAARLRALIEPRSDPEAVNLFNTLWTMEFKAVPLSAQDEVRARVRKDAERLRGMDLQKNRMLLTELGNAYKLLGDAEGTKWVEAQTPRSTRSAAAEAITQWHRANPAKMGAFARDVYHEALLEKTEEWVRQWPDEPYPRYERYMALQMQPDTAMEDQIQAAEEWIRVYDLRGGGSSSPSPYQTVANYYSSRNMRFSELPSLVEKAVKEIERPVEIPVSDLNPVDGNRAVAMNSSRWYTWNMAANVYIKVKQYDKAHEMLARIGESLTQTKPPESAGAEDKRTFERAAYQYWDSMAKLAHIEGRNDDELLNLRSALVNSPPSGVIRTMEEYRISQLSELWRAIKGTPSGFDEWLAEGGVTNRKNTGSTPAVASTAMAWTKMEKPLPDFQMQDAEGKTWKLADLKGRVTLVNLWATWCGPCKEELPYLQKLYNKVQERKDIRVLTLNVDDNPGLIEPFLKENHYTFPVLPASAFVNKLVPELSIPRNWIVDASGTLRLERIGFGSGDDKWIEETIGVMEKAK